MILLLPRLVLLSAIFRIWIMNGLVWFRLVPHHLFFPPYWIMTKHNNENFCDDWHFSNGLSLASHSPLQRVYNRDWDVHVPSRKPDNPDFPGAWRPSMPGPTGRAPHHVPGTCLQNTWSYVPRTVGPLLRREAGERISFLGPAMANTTHLRSFLFLILK